MKTNKTKAINLAKHLIPELKEDFSNEIELNDFLSEEYDFYNEFLRELE